MRQLFWCIIAFVIYSCTQDNQQQPNIAVKKQIPKPPDTIVLKTPFITRLDTCPLPRTIFVPQKPGGSYLLKTDVGTQTIPLLPPVTKPADYFVPMQNYNTEQGLALSSVVSSYMDKNDNLWFGTWGGVSRFDGKSFTSYTTAQGLAGNQVVSICEDKTGNLWFGTVGGGVSRFDGRSFTNYTTTEGLAGNIVWGGIIEDKKGNLWFGTSGGVSRMNPDGKSFTNDTTAQGLVNNNISSMLEDKSGNLWFGTWDNGVSYYDGKTFTSYTLANGLTNNPVMSILEDKNGNLWFSTAGGGVFELERGEKSLPDTEPFFKNYTTIEGLVSNDVRSSAKDKKGNLWFGTRNGVSRLDWDDNSPHGKKSFTNLTTRQGLVNNDVGSILCDKKGNIWFCTDGGGVSYLDRDWKSLTSLTTSQGLLSNKVFRIVEDRNGNIWLAAGGAGLTRLNLNGKSLTEGKASLTHYTTSQGLPDNRVGTIFEDKSGDLWWAYSFWGMGVTRYDGNSFTTYTTAQGLANDAVNSIFEDKSGDLWFGTEGGISRLDPDRKFFTNYTTAQGLPDNFVISILEDKSGNFWFPTPGHGVSRMTRDGKSLVNYTSVQGLPNNIVLSIFEDEHGNFWFTSLSGLSRYDGQSFTNYSRAHGLSHDDVSEIVMDKDGNIWLGTQNGFTALKGFVQDTKHSGTGAEVNLKPSNGLSNSELEDRGFKPVFEIYNNKTGYPIKDKTSNIWVTREGIILAGTSEKLVFFDYRSIRKDTSPPNVFIQGIKINNEAICWYDLKSPKFKDSTGIPANVVEEMTIYGNTLSESQRDTMRNKFRGIKFDSITRFYPVPVNLVLPYRHNNVTFDFAAIEPSRSTLVRYQYMLEGYDDDWSPLTDKSSTTYGNIHEGNYTFKLKSQSPDGVWSKEVIYTFKVRPPWYRAWWAYAVYILVFVTALWSFIRWRVRTFRRQKALLEKKVALRTHQLQEEKEKVESTLTELKSTQGQLIQSEKMASLGELTAGIAHEIQNPLNFVNNFSEVNKELLAEMNEEIEKGNFNEAATIAKNITDNQEKINHHGKRADAIVKGMLQHSRTSGGQKEPTNINALADEYLRLAFYGFRAKDKSFNAKFETDFDPAIEKINVVPQEIGRVILNLINNAFYAVNEKKKQNPNARLPDVQGYDPTVSVSTKKTNGKVEIKVADNGIGIPQNVLDKIFQPFFTTKPTGQGTGLGLSLAYDIIKAHGGELKVNTEESHYAEFIIELPYEDKNQMFKK